MESRIIKRFLLERPEMCYGYQVTVCDNCITIVKRWNTWDDARDRVQAALTFRLDDYKDIVAVINNYIEK